jgi:hypothetical protein
MHHHKNDAHEPGLKRTELFANEVGYIKAMP